MHGQRGKRWTAGEAGLKVEDAAGKWEVNAKRVGMDEGVRYIELKWTHRSAASGESREASFAELLETMGKMPLPPPHASSGGGARRRRLPNRLC